MITCEGICVLYLIPPDLPICNKWNLPFQGDIVGCDHSGLKVSWFRRTWNNVICPNQKGVFGQQREQRLTSAYTFPQSVQGLKVTICMKYQILFSGEIRNISKCRLLKFLPRVLSTKKIVCLGANYFLQELSILRRDSSVMKAISFLLESSLKSEANIFILQSSISEINHYPHAFRRKRGILLHLLSVHPSIRMSICNVTPLLLDHLS